MVWTILRVEVGGGCGSVWLMTHVCSYTPAYVTYPDAAPCQTPPSHVVYADELDSDGYLTPVDHEGIYVCAHHSGSVAQELLITKHPAQVNIVPLMPKLDQP